MDVVWARNRPTTVRDAYRVIGAQREVAYTTIMTTMTRLAERGVLTVHERGKMKEIYYAPALNRSAFEAYVVRMLLDRLTVEYGDVVRECVGEVG